MQSDLATFGGWCFLAGVFFMVSGDGITNFAEAEPSRAWPWLYLIPFGLSLPAFILAGRVTLTGRPRTAFLYQPLVALLVAFALSAIFSQARPLSVVAVGALAGIALFWWFVTHAIENEWLANATWTVVAVATVQLAAEVIARRFAEGLHQIPLNIPAVAWLGKLQLTWVLNLVAPFLLARFIGDRRRWSSWLNGIAWITAGTANYLLLSRMGTLVFTLTTLSVCLMNRRYWRRWIWIIGLAAVGSGVMIANNLRISTFVASSFLDRTQNPGIDLRLNVWGEAWRMFLAHPLVGIGVGTFDDVAYEVPGTKANLDFQLIQPCDSWAFRNCGGGWHAHNVPLHILTESGLPGLVAWIFLWYIVLTALVRAWKSDDAQSRLYAGATLVSVLAFQMLSMTEVLIAARAVASLRMHLTLALLVVAGLRVSLPAP